jgi:hypothetical protein
MGKFVECCTVKDVRLGVDKHWGVTARSGDIPDAHKIHSIKVKDLTVSSPDLDGEFNVTYSFS